MPRPKGIPERLIEKVLERAGEGLSTRKIAAWLKREHDITVGHNAVAAMLRERRGEREEAAKTVIAEHVAGRLTADLAGLDKQRKNLERVIDEMVSLDLTSEDAVIGKTPRASVLATLMARYESIVDKTLKFSGAIPPETQERSDRLQQLREEQIRAQIELDKARTKALDKGEHEDRGPVEIRVVTYARPTE